MNFDLVIIGSGPGGYVAAIRGAQLGLRVAIVEKEALGGVCLNWGCIPTKSFLRSAEVLKIIRESEKYGIKSKLGDIDIREVVKRSRSIAKKLSSGVEYLLKKNKVVIFDGEASFKTSKSIVITSKNNVVKEISSKNICIASGGRPREISGVPNSSNVWFYKEALQVDNIPKKLLIVGSGAIGVEFASFFAQMGSEVSVLEAKPTILPNEDLEVSNFVEKQFLKRGIKVYKNHSLLSLKEKGSLFEAELKSENKTLSLEFEKAILAIGIVGNIENLNLESININCSSGSIVVDEYCEKTLGKEDVFSICFNANKKITYTVEDLEQLYGKVEIKNTRSVSTLVVFVTDEKASEEAWSTLDQKVSWYIENITNDDGGYNIYEATDGLLELNFPIP